MTNARFEDDLDTHLTICWKLMQMKEMFSMPGIFITKQRSRPSDNVIDNLCALHFILAVENLNITQVW